MNKGKINVRDLIFLAVLNVVVIVGYAIIVALCCSTGIGLFFCTAAAFLILGPVYMLMVRKCSRKGTFIICGILMAVIGIIGGRIGTTLGCIFGGIVADFVAGNYKSRVRLVLGYITYAFGFALGIYLPGVIFGQAYLTGRMAAKGMEGNALLEYIQYYNYKVIAGVLILNAVAALIGAIIGNGIVDRHFVKAGIVKEEEHGVFPFERAIQKDRRMGLRKLLQNPEKILEGWIFEGQTVMDLGCGMGYFTLPMAHAVGERGTVYAVDVQEEMLEYTKEKLRGMAAPDCVSYLCSTPGSIPSMDMNNPVDFALMFAVAHEIGDLKAVLSQLYDVMAPGGTVLLSEPVLHVSAANFARTLEYAASAGFAVVKGPKILMANTVLLKK